MVVMLQCLNHETIVTVSDAAQSFIQRPDDTTKNCCILSSRTVENLWKVPEMRHGQRYQPRRREPWHGALSGGRRVVSLIMYLAVIVTAGVLFGTFSSRLEGCIDFPMICPKRNTFGNVDFNYLLRIYLGSTSIIPYVFFANVPQALVSVLCLTCNGLFTAMLANRE
ncbi:hypothetical protein EJ02DRAFT_50254 [Clathrospora elynae]|uniref:Uncharacterized protein n=1 Tax=Clathrospora elynae TaxID=706981 RepID=A0A6A5SAK0_9PLEO|nr:hypothetical protein EJ02DRAFT_50254 [Clathrospora elynae]